MSKYKRDRRAELPADYWMMLERCWDCYTLWAFHVNWAVRYPGGTLYPVDGPLKMGQFAVIADLVPLRTCRTIPCSGPCANCDFQPAFEGLEAILESVLDVPKTQEYETAYPYHYIRLIVTGISDTKKALVFLKQHFGDSSFQQTKDRLKELPLLIYSGLDTGTAPLENSLDRWGLMYEKQQISLEKFLEDQAYIRNL